MRGGEACVPVSKLALWLSTLVSAILNLFLHVVNVKFRNFDNDKVIFRDHRTKSKYDFVGPSHNSLYCVKKKYSY